MRKGKVIALGTLTGLVLGATAGILFAPEKGTRTRKQIKDKSHDYMNQLKSKLDEFRNSIAGKFNSTKRDAEYLAGKGKAKYEEAKRDVKNAASDFKHSTI
jgi:gas vesicle protein